MPENPLEECDLVMKGGVTSGIVYPSVVLALKNRYRFRNIGGTSAGAIAAAVTAAAEYGRDRPGGGFPHLAALRDELSAPKALLGLFHASAATDSLLSFGLQLLPEMQRPQQRSKRQWALIVRSALRGAAPAPWRRGTLVAIVVAVALAVVFG